MPTHEVRLRDAAVQLHNYKLNHRPRDQAYEINVDFYAETAVDEMLIWTSIATRMRVKIGLGAYVVVGDSRATAADLGAFTAGETKSGVIEVEIPLGVDTRDEELALNIGYGV